MTKDDAAKLDITSPVKATILGAIKWYAPWRKYSFFPQPHTVFEKDCLREIADFCEKEMKEKKK